ncbi:hypothetical protein [Herbaspirillum sp. meg3]|uniref:hypothetical protein n=1 Tax=Herbaspirillum sp. meg3 TaxID=2025949 RepID=UPI0018DF696C|nr:hypothetical protein [Herbaspirillum sp. meg3]
MSIESGKSIPFENRIPAGNRRRGMHPIGSQLHDKAANYAVDCGIAYLIFWHDTCSLNFSGRKAGMRVFNGKQIDQASMALLGCHRMGFRNRYVIAGARGRNA